MNFRLCVGSLLAISLLVAGCGGPPPKTVLVYDIPAGNSGVLVPIEKVVLAVERRVRSFGKVRAVSDRRIEVSLYDDEPSHVARMRERLEVIGSLEFRIVANRLDHPTLIAKAESSPIRLVLDEDGVTNVAAWAPLAQDAQEGLIDDLDLATRRAPNAPDGDYEILLLLDPYDVKGAYLRRAMATYDQSGRPAISFFLNAEGAKWFGRLTGDNLPEPATGRARKLAIILNGFVHSAPTIQSRITDRGEITGNFTQAEIDDLVAILNAGVLPAPPRFVQQRPAR